MGLNGAEGRARRRNRQDGPAEKAGPKRGDTIVAVEGQTISEPKELSRRVATIEPGKSVSLTVLRDGKERTVTVEIGRQKDRA